LYCHLSYLGFDDEDIYRVIEMIILDYGGNPLNIYTEKDIYTPKILRVYFSNIVKSRPWYFKPETDADNEVYNNYRTFRKIIYVDPRLKLVSRDFKRQRDPKTPKDYIRQIINKYGNPDLTSFQIVANVNELVEYVPEVALKLLEPCEFDKIFTFEVYSSDVDWAIIPGFITNVIPEKEEIIVSYMITVLST
jgi:tRNA uridine 5-carbamoylmethylation protein Kti12